MSSSTASRDRRHAAGLGILSLFVLGVAAWLVGAAVLPGLVPGWRSVVVTSGSMEPSVSAGDVVVVAPTGPGIAVGTVVLFSTPTGAVTHRIVGLNQDGTFATRGDANPAPDSTPLRSEQILGRARLVVPNAGLPTLWWRDGSWAPLVASFLLLGVTAAGLGVAAEIWRASRGAAPARRGSGGGLTLTVAVVAVGLCLVGTTTSTSTARAAFSGTGANGTSTFVAASATRYRLLANGNGDQRSSLFLPLSTTGSPQAALPNLDTDRNTDPGLTLQPSTLDLAETDSTRFQLWGQFAGSGGIDIVGPTRLRIWTAMTTSDGGSGLDFIAGLYDCNVWQLDCNAIASASAQGSGSREVSPVRWGETVFDFGTLAHTVPVGRALLIKVVGNGLDGPTWVGFDAVAQPSALEVGP